MSDDPRNGPADDPLAPLLAGVGPRPRPGAAARERAFRAIEEEWEALQARRRKRRRLAPVAMAATYRSAEPWRVLVGDFAPYTSGRRLCAPGGQSMAPVRQPLQPAGDVAGVQRRPLPDRGERSAVAGYRTGRIIRRKPIELESRRRALGRAGADRRRMARSILGPAVQRQGASGVDRRHLAIRHQRNLPVRVAGHTTGHAPRTTARGSGYRSLPVLLFTGCASGARLRNRARPV